MLPAFVLVLFLLRLKFHEDPVLYFQATEAVPEDGALSPKKTVMSGLGRYRPRSEVANELINARKTALTGSIWTLISINAKL